MFEWIGSILSLTGAFLFSMRKPYIASWVWLVASGVLCIVHLCMKNYPTAAVFAGFEVTNVMAIWNWRKK